MSIRSVATMAAMALATALAAACAAHAQEAVAVDHHVHVHSPDILAFLPAYCASSGRIGACDPAFTTPFTVGDLLADMDAAGVGRAYMMSTAYLAESPMMVPPPVDAPALVRAANAFTVDQARRHPDRLTAFIGVNPLTPTALAEIERWKDDPFAAGVKIHLTNSGVDLRNPGDVARLQAVFRAAARSDMVIMIHMRTRAADYGARDVAVFLDQILPEASGTPVIIAHSGGWGGLDAVTFDAITAFADALEADPAAWPNLSFDLAQVFDAETPRNDLDRLAPLMRRIGVERFVPGSDWPFSGDLRAYFDMAYPRLPLTDEEWGRVRRRHVLSARHAPQVAAWPVVVPRRNPSVLSGR